MNKYFATFGQGQYLGALANSYVEIHAPSEMMARIVMKNAFGEKWAATYNEEEFTDQPDRFGLMRLVVWDENGNVIGRGR